jgi:hypothetical protein
MASPHPYSRGKAAQATRKAVMGMKEGEEDASGGQEGMIPSWTSPTGDG